MYTCIIIYANNWVKVNIVKEYLLLSKLYPDRINQKLKVSDEQRITGTELLNITKCWTNCVNGIKVARLQDVSNLKFVMLLTRGETFYETREFQYVHTHTQK